MGGTQNELSQFVELEWTKCGEIRMCANRNDFQLSCNHCSDVFYQMAVFARHLYWEHQLGHELQRKHQGRNDLSTYTVEELLSNKNIDNTFSSNENISNTISDEDDTGFGSDEELKREIQELLTSIASADSSSKTENEYSENVSDYGHIKNNHGNRQNAQDQDMQRYNKNFQRSCKREPSQQSEVEENMNYKTTTNFIKKNNQHNSKKSENAPKIAKKLPLKQYLESKKFLLQSDDESNSSDDWLKRNTRNKRKEVVSNVLKKNTNEIHATKDELDNLRNIKDIQCIRSAVNDQASTNSCAEKTSHALDNKDIYNNKNNNNILNESEDLILSNISNIVGGKDNKEYDTSVTENESNFVITKSSEVENVEIKYVAPTINDLNPYHNETNENWSSVEEIKNQQSKSTTREMAIEKPLDLSFNKSNEWADMELEEISELLSINVKATTELITQDIDKLLVQQQPNYTDNSSSLFNADQLQISDIVVDNLLPPFSKFFTNNANTLKNSNTLMMQSTPKEKNVKTSQTKELTMKTTKPNECIATEISQTAGENVENIIPEHKIYEFSKNLQRRFKISKRISQCDIKENKSKKTKQEVENAEEIIKENKTTKKPDIEILSVDIIHPNENKNQNMPANFASSSSNVLLDESKAKNCDDLQIPSVIQETNINEINWGACTSESIIEDLTPVCIIYEKLLSKFLLISSVSVLYSI